MLFHPFHTGRSRFFLGFGFGLLLGLLQIWLFSDSQLSWLNIWTRAFQGWGLYFVIPAMVGLVLARVGPRTDYQREEFPIGMEEGCVSGGISAIVAMLVLIITLVMVTARNYPPILVFALVFNVFGIALAMAGAALGDVIGRWWANMSMEAHK